MDRVQKVRFPATIKSHKAIELRAKIKFCLFPTLKIEKV